MERKSVVIIGAGASGISAATRLYENGIEDIVVLEAGNRIGGRVHTIDVKNGILEMGAQWIHGEKNNVVHEIASARKLACERASDLYTYIYIRSNGEVVEPLLANRISKISKEAVFSNTKDAQSFKSCGEYFTHLKVYTTQELLEKCNEFGKIIICTFFSYTYSLNVEFNKGENADIPDDMKSEIIEFCHQSMNSYDASETWFNSSVSNFEDYEECEGNQNRLWNGTGYRILFDILMEKSQKLSNDSFKSKVIALNTEVKRISSSDLNNSILVECSNGRTIQADHVIITTSLGVLRERYATLFENIPLPELKIRAINNLEFGTVDKIFLEYSKPWWPTDKAGFDLLWTKKDREEYIEKGLGWVVDIFAVRVVDFAPDILSFWISGASARTMESLDETLVQKAVVQMLRKFLSKKWEIPEPDRIIRTTWHSNKYFRGSYSNRNLGADAANVSALTLSSPVNNEKGAPVLLFAGEATSPNHYSTVHGAVESGWREADRLISYLKKS